MNRRALLGAMLAACAAPAYVKAGILMPVRQIVLPRWFGMDFGVDNGTVIWRQYWDEAKGPVIEPVPEYLVYIEPDPERERQEFVRQLTARVQIEPGEPEPMRGEVGRFEGIRILTGAAASP